MILLSGGTGFVGGSLVHRMLKDKLPVRCLVRTPEKARKLNIIGIETSIGDITYKPSILKAMEGVDTVIHLVGILTEVGLASFQMIHVTGTKNMCETAKEIGIKRFIYMSALGSRKDARSIYHKTKWQAEEIVRQTGIDYTIFKPSVIFGRMDKFTNLFAKAVKLSPFILVPGDGKNKMQPVSVDDVADVIIKTVKEEKLTGDYELGGQEKLTFDEIIKKICKVMNRKRYLIHLPIGLLNPAAKIMETVLPKPPLTQDQLLMLQEDNVTDSTALETVFGIKPKGFEEGIREYLQ